MSISSPKKNTSLIDVIIFPILILFSGWYILPAMQITLPPRLMIILLVIAIFLNFINANRITREIKIFCILLACSTIIAIMYYFNTYSGDAEKAIGIITQTIMGFSPIIIGVIIKDKSKKYQKYFIIVEVALFLFILFITSTQMFANPYIVRMLANGNEEFNTYRLQNIGGFGFCYAICFLTIFLIGVLILTKVRHKFLLKSIIAYFLLFLVISEYFTALILIVVFALAFLYKRKGSISIITTILVVILLVVLNCIPYFVTSTNSTVVEKIVEVSNLIFRQSTGVSTTARSEVYSVSFEAFANNPLIGLNIYDSYSYSVGSHSSILDTIAKVGIIGGSIYYIIISLAWKTCNGLFQDKKKKQIMNHVFLSYLVCAFLNPAFIAYEIEYFTFALIPCLMICLKTDNEGGEV